MRGRDLREAIVQRTLPRIPNRAFELACARVERFRTKRRHGSETSIGSMRGRRRVTWDGDGDPSGARRGARAEDAERWEVRSGPPAETVAPARRIPDGEVMARATAGV